MITYRKTSEGEWCVCGPTAELKVGHVTVTKKSGEAKVEQVTRLGKPFLREGVEYAYGYLAAEETKQCWECGRSFTYRECRDSEGDWGDQYCGC